MYDLPKRPVNRNITVDVNLKVSTLMGADETMGYDSSSGFISSERGSTHFAITIEEVSYCDKWALPDLSWFLYGEKWLLSGNKIKGT